MTQRWRQRSLLAFGILAVCGSLGLIEALQLYAGDSALREESWWVAFWRALPPWILLAALSPIAVFASDRWPVRGARWRSALARHAAVSVPFSALHIVLVATWGSVRPEATASFSEGVVWLTSIYFVYDVLAYGALAGAIHAFRIHQEAGERREEADRLLRELDHARLKMIEGKLHPHFVFNTLNTIIGLAARGDHQSVERTLSAFSELLQVALDDRSIRPVPLREELDLLERYLEIQRARFGDRLDVQWSVDDNALDHAVPGLILQPLVENALGHAISRSPGGGTVAVGASLEGDVLRLSVDDTGAGSGAGRARPGHGIGLRSIRLRLAALYGERASVQVSERPGGGTSVVTFIPSRVDEATSH